jgi:hypothetical protein
MISDSIINDLGFMEARAKLLDLAAFFDRGERRGVTEDFRFRTIFDGLEILIDGKPERTRRILEALSDPSSEPLENPSGKAAIGAWDHSKA